MKRIFFFATPTDIVPVLKRFESNAPLKFVEMDDVTTPNRAIYLESSDIPEPGIATRETGSQSQPYLVSKRDTKNILRPYTTRKGERCWALDNGSNEETVILRMAGQWRDMLLPGEMSTLHDTPVAQQLMRWFIAALKAEGFTKIENWWLGKEAMEMLKAGKRLSKTAEQSPPAFDLKLPGEGKAR